MSGFELETREPQEKINIITSGDMTWVDIVPPTEKAMTYLEEHYHFDPLSLEDCLSRRQISKMDVFKDYLFFVFHYPYYDKKTRIAKKQQWSAFIKNNLVVTVHTGELRPLVKMFRDCQENIELRQNSFSKGSGYLLYLILDRAIDAYFPVLDSILSLLQATEDAVFDETADATTELSILRRDIIVQRMVMFPTRTLLKEIKNKLNTYSQIDVTPQYEDLMDHIDKICETLNECQEVVEVYKDTDSTLITHHLNRLVRILNIFATVILPFLAVSSIYGMNIPLPGGLERGSLNTFLILLAVMLALTGSMLFYFHRRRWI